MLSVNKILNISLLVCLLLILMVFIGIQHNIKQYNVIMMFVSIVILVVLATLSTHK